MQAEETQKIENSSRVIWLDTVNGSEPEVGNVVFQFDRNGEKVYSISWLEGWRCRDDDVEEGRILALLDPSGQAVSMGDFEFRGYVTEAGHAWLAQRATPRRSQHP